MNLLINSGIILLLYIYQLVSSFNTIFIFYLVLKVFDIAVNDKFY